MSSTEPVIFDSRTSLDKYESVERLLARSRDDNLMSTVSVVEKRTTISALLQLKDLDLPILSRLSKVREAARQDLIEAETREASADDLIYMESVVRVWDDIIDQAHEYLFDIEEELANPSGSSLQLEQGTDGNLPAPRVLIRSLDAWAKSKYGIPKSHATEAVNVPRANSVAKKADSSESTGATRYNNLSATFAFLVDMYIAKTGARHIVGGRLNVNPLAKDIEAAATAANKGSRIGGQTVESITSRIEEAVKIKRGKLPAA